MKNLNKNFMMNYEELKKNINRFHVHFGNIFQYKFN